MNHTQTYICTEFCKSPASTLIRYVFIILLVASLSNSAEAQKQKVPRTYEQSAFAMEGVQVSKPVDLPEDALQVLRKNKFVLSCLEHDQTPEDIPGPWFVASEIHLGGTKEIDLVVQPRKLSVTPASNACLFHAHSVPFWVLRGTPGGYSLVFEDHAQELEILNSRSNGFCDIKTALSTTVGVTITLFKFEGHQYRLYERNTKRW